MAWKKGCSWGRCWGRRCSRPPGKRKEDEAHFYIHFDIEIFVFFLLPDGFLYSKKRRFQLASCSWWRPKRPQNPQYYLCCIKAIRMYDISFSEFSTKWLLSWKRNNFGKIELVRMVQIALKWQFCSKCTYISALLYLVVVTTSIFCRNLWAESCDASRASSSLDLFLTNGIIVLSSPVVDDYVISWQAYILVENKKLGYFLNTQHQDYDE